MIIAAIALFISISVGTYVFFRKPAEPKEKRILLVSTETQTKPGLWLATLPTELDFDPPTQIDIDNAITCYCELTS